MQKHVKERRLDEMIFSGGMQGVKVPFMLFVSSESEQPRLQTMCPHTLRRADCLQRDLFTFYCLGFQNHSCTQDHPSPKAKCNKTCSKDQTGPEIKNKRRSHMFTGGSGYRSCAKVLNCLFF